MNFRTPVTIVCIAVLSLSSTLTAAGKFDKTIYSELPIREVTVFKDGHAYILHEGILQTDPKGNVTLTELPSPIMGTFWAYSADPKRKLQCVISSREDITVEKTPVNIEDLLKGNIGSKVMITEISNQHPYQAEIIRLLEEKTGPQTLPDNQQRNYNPNENQKIILLKIAEGIKAIAVNQIRNITFLGTPNETTDKLETRDTMLLKLDNANKNNASAEIGMAYIQKGIRWIPSYRVEIDGNGNAVIKLQATIVNELADLNDITTHLVIGVPKFAFRDTPDPISFQETVAQLSGHFRPDSRTAFGFSNSIMSQRARPRFDVYDGESNSPAGNQLNLGPELQGAKSNEDLFVFTLDHITLKKGQRMVLPIAEYTLTYEDIYTVDIQFRPPLEMRRNFNSDQHLQLARLFHAPKAIHKMRLKNDSEYPLTTAPATIFRDDKVLAQGMMEFTSIGGQGDLEITTALDIKVKSGDQQEEVTPNAVQWNNDQYSKINMCGSIKLNNYSDKKVKVYVTRSVLGNMDTATHDGQVKQHGHGYDGLTFENGVPIWWNWCSWPWWWYHFNSIGQTNWELEIESKEEIKLEYNWHYYWR